LRDQKEVKQVAETAAAVAAEASWPQTRAVLRVIFIIIAVIAALWILRAITGVILLIVLAIFFAYLIAPLVEFVHRPFNIRGREHLMPRVVAIAIVYLVLFGSLGIALYFLLPQLGTQITEFAKQAPAYFTSARARTAGLKDFYDRYQIPLTARDAISRNITHVIETVGTYTTEGLGNFFLASLSYVPWLVLIPILAFFLLKDADSFRRSALQMLPRGRWRWRGDEFFQDVNSTLAAYIRAQLIACLMIGAICAVAFFLMGVPYSLMLGIMAGLFEFIPLVGPLTLAIVAALIASFYSLNLAIGVIVFLGVLRIAQDYVIYPKIIGQGIHLHPLAVILAILAGAELAGVAGIFLAIPVIAIATVSYRHWLEHKGSEGLVADLLKPAEEAVTTSATPSGKPSLPPAPARPELKPEAHPTTRTTPEEMSRARPDLNSGELKLERTD
jgi:predicted PurR-regulated permease PerM